MATSQGTSIIAPADRGEKTICWTLFHLLCCVPVCGVGRFFKVVFEVIDYVYFSDCAVRGAS